MHTNIEEQEKFTSTRIKIKTQILLNEMKASKRSASHDELIYDMLLFFKNNNINPSTASKPVQELIAEMRDTFVKFFRTFEKEKFAPFVTTSNESFLAILDKLDGHRIDYNRVPIIEKPIEKSIDLSFNSSDESALKSGIKNVISQIDSAKQFNQKGGIAIVEMRTVDYNKIIDDLKELCI